MSVTTSKHQSPSFHSTVSLNNPVSLRSFRRPPPPVTTVVTSPPWARDEPPSPKEQAGSINDTPNATESRLSDVASFQSNPSQSASRWWTFTLPRQRNDSFDQLTSSPKVERKGFRDLSLSWMPTTNNFRESVYLRKDKEKEGDSPISRPSLHIPPQPSTSFTLAQSHTPGWDTPWTPRAAAQGPFRNNRHDNSYGFDNRSSHSSTKEPTGWKKQVRTFILTHTYVPLLFRFINISFTTAALAQAIIIRRIEIKNNAMGAVGSSPTVVIIFAPLTLVHVMAAIYLEYFGRPLGLWRTSAKLAHTLSEVLFICLWSAALSLCFDNFFTSLIPCAAPSRTAWYNQLPRPHTDVPGFEGTLGDRICDHQLSLICLVGVGLIAYCSNLIISLYRIFEKVKSIPTSVLPTLARTH
ncbi:hypothetical protein CVT24_000867 [Panaeolus cyanescens]|uniref:Uncharacterized protein n=1 Tax=Panaeolus cyanescens TaxID=181874 RepID=A0A409YCC6_9AGAR|nr:hypothetical protein CVT24_000867 [Panaeolus cyanescens]